LGDQYRRADADDGFASAPMYRVSNGSTLAFSAGAAGGGSAGVRRADAATAAASSAASASRRVSLETVRTSP